MNEQKPFSYYWKFYWPLTLMGLTMVAANQFQNGILARYPNAVQEIAIFAIASSTFNFFSSCFAFIPQAANVLVKGKADSRLFQKFILIIACTELLFLLGILFTPWGHQVLSFAFTLSPDILTRVLQYLMVLSPLLFLQSFNQYFTGLLIKSEKTGLVTILNTLFLSVMIVGILIGYNINLPLVWTLVGSQILGKALQLTGTFLAFSKYGQLIDQDSSKNTLISIWKFFWPVALTSTMFSFSRPILYAFVSRMPDSAPIIAALRLSFDFAMIFQNMVNQFRHLFITYAKEDLAGVKSFMIKATLGVTCLMALFIGSQTLYNILIYIIHVPETVARDTVEVSWTFCIVPFLIGVRNYYHGHSMLLRKTKIMGFSGIARVITTSLCAWLLLQYGHLNHIAAGFALILGFFIELLINAGHYHLFNFQSKKSD